jgi:hypothetical protein
MFFPSDQSDSLEPEVEAKVPGWMHSAEQVSIGGRKQVLEDGNDVCNSESDSDSEDHGSEIKDAYQGVPTDSHGGPLGASHRVSTEQANALRASVKHISSQASRMDSPPAQERKATPVNSDNEDQERMTEDQKKVQAGARRRSQKAAQASTDPMETRRSEKASRAGGLRSGGGPG